MGSKKARYMSDEDFAEIGGGGFVGRSPIGRPMDKRGIKVQKYKGQAFLLKMGAGGSRGSWLMPRQLAGHDRPREGSRQPHLPTGPAWRAGV